MTVAECIAKELKDRGVNYVFGIPGGPSIPYMDEFRKAGIEFVLTSNETAAGIMADVTGRLTGIPGVCHATFGPGATNLSTGVGGAMLDRSPLIALTSVLPELMRKRTAQMNIDQQQLFEPLAKASVIINEENVCSVLNDAFELALEEYPGPVHLGIPSDLADLQVRVGKDEYINNRSEQYETLIDDEITGLLEYAQKPLLVIGLTAARAGIGDEINTFLEKHKLPVIITPMAKGLVDENHESYCGVLFHAASDRLSAVINEADIVIGLGYDPVELNYETWLPDVPLVHLNTVSTDMPGGIMVKQVNGPLGGLLSMMEPLFKTSMDWDLSSLRECRESIQGLIRKDYENFGPVKILNILQEMLPSNTALCLDVGSHLHLFGQYWKTGSEGKLLITNGWSGMGFGIPAAIASAINMPDIPVACVSGDGGFLMTCGELITARRMKLGVLFIILADRELNLIRLKEQRRGHDAMSVDLCEDKLIGEKSFLGVPVISCYDESALRDTLTGLFPMKGPLVLELYIDASDYEELVIS